MSITVADLNFFQSERMTDFADGGGRMTANEIVSGAENQIFDDVTDQDRAAGDVSIRKVYVAVTSADTDKYLDAGVAVWKEPADSAASVLAFSTGDFYDERADLKTRIEQTISRGPRYNGWLYGQHLVGQRALLVWQRVETPILPAGARIEVVSRSSGVEQYGQFCWVTRITDEIRTMYEVYNGVTIQYQVRVLTCEIAEPLQAAYSGLEPSRADPAPGTATALVYETRYNAEAVPLYGVRPITEDAAIGDFSVTVDSLYSPLIPTAFAETALPDVTPGADAAALVAANAATVHFTTTTQCVKPDASLFLGTACTPGTLSIAVSGAALSDDNGAVKLGQTTVGEIDYGNGVARFNSACPNYGAASKTVTFKPAGRPLQVAATSALAVTAENRGYVWVQTLAPVPAAGSLRVSYRVNEQWYSISDQGNGALSGADSSYGSGNLNRLTGTATITTGALPDVGSDILFAWGVEANYTSRGGAAVDPPKVTGTAQHAPVDPSSFSLTWLDHANVSRTVTDDGAGNLTGTGGSGTIRYATGEWTLTPATLPDPGREFSASYDHGTSPHSQTLTAAPVSGTVTLSLAATNLTPGSVDVSFPYGTSYDYYTADGTIAVVDAPGGTAILTDDGAGNLIGPVSGTVNYTTGTISLNVVFSATIPVMGSSWIGSIPNGDGSILQSGLIQTGTRTQNLTLTDVSTPFVVHYRTADSSASITGEITELDQLRIDLTRQFNESVVFGSARFGLGGALYADIGGQLYKDPDPTTGVGQLAGSLDSTTGIARIALWTAGAANAVTLESLVTDAGDRSVDRVVFRTPISPLKAGTLQLRYTTVAGVAKSKTVDGTGLLEDADCTIRVDYRLGVIRARFGRWRVDSELSPAEKLEPWYDPLYRIDFAGTLKIWQPKLVPADTIVYNAVAQTFLPPDSALLGLDAARVPPDGKALIFNTGRLVLVHHTASVAQGSLSPTQVIDCGRVRLYRAVIEDATGKRLGADQYTVNRELGTVTMSPTLNLTGFSAPYAVIHSIADLSRLVAVDISGRLSLNKALSHAYPADDSRCSAVLPVGTMQARVSNLFAQSTWTGVWSDELIGSEPLAQFDDASYPIIVSNRGAYTDRVLVRFTGATAFDVIGENLGVIGNGTTGANCAPVNPLNGLPYFTIPYQGWGSGWATGNCLRFNLIGANHPIDLIRAIQPSAPTGQDPDQVELIFVGNVDA